MQFGPDLSSCPNKAVESELLFGSDWKIWDPVSQKTINIPLMVVLAGIFFGIFCFTGNICAFTVPQGITDKFSDFVGFIMSYRGLFGFLSCFFIPLLAFWPASV